jgi:MoaA/NifB/PqqE/SkfB family radical SAM enzyme
MGNETGPTVERVDVKTGFCCNNRCRFCVQGNKRDIHGNKSTDEVKETLRSARADSDSIVFTGGEVTIRKDFLELVAYAKSLGFRVIQIQTNGRMLAYRKFCEQTIEAGGNEFSPALHGHTEELHDYLTLAKGSFRQTVQCIKNLSSLGQKIITNSVITRSNYRHLPELAELLVQLGVHQYQFAFVHSLGTALEYFHSVTPRMALVEPFVRRGLAVGQRRGIFALTEAIPYCFMRGNEHAVAEAYIPRTKIFDAKMVLDDYTQYRWNEGKTHGPPCRECTWLPVCEGPWKEYPEHYGWGEFTPRTDECTLLPSTESGKE